MAQAMRGGLRTAAQAVLARPVRAGYSEVKQAIDQWQVKTGRRSDRAIADLLHAELRPGDTCVDLGAGVGLLTVVMANLVGGSGRVYAFEPAAENEPKLLANARWCGLVDRVRLHIADAATIRLDEHLPAGQRVDFVRVNLEGDLDRLFKGMARTLRQWRPTLLVECRSQAAWEACGDLAGHGYTLRDARRQAVDVATATPLAHVLATHPRHSAA